MGPHWGKMNNGGVRVKARVRARTMTKYGAAARRCGLDQMKNLKVETDANTTAMGGNRKRYQLADEKAMSHSHGAGGDHIGKFGLEALLLEAVRTGAAKLPEGFNLSTYLPSMTSPSSFCRRRHLRICMCTSRRASLSLAIATLPTSASSSPASPIAS